VTEELLIKRRLAQTGAVAASFTLREQRGRILGRIAYEHMLNADEPRNLLSWPLAIKIVQAINWADNVGVIHFIPKQGNFAINFFNFSVIFLFLNIFNGRKINFLCPPRFSIIRVGKINF
jgi:hypothetical protein